MARRVAMEMTVEAFDARTKSYEVEEVEGSRAALAGPVRAGASPISTSTFYFAAARATWV